MDDIDADMLPEDQDQDLTGIPEEGHNSDLDGEGDGEGEGSVGMNMSMIMNSGSSSSSIVRSTRSPMSNTAKKYKNKYKKQLLQREFNENSNSNIGLNYEDDYDLTTATDLNTPNADVSSHQPINNRYPSNNLDTSKIIMSLQDPSTLIPLPANVARSRSKSLSHPSVTTKSPRSDDDAIITTIPLPPLLPSLPPALQLPQQPHSQEQTSTTDEISTLQESTLALSLFASKDILPPTTSQLTRKNRRHSEPFADRISSAEFTTLTDTNNINNNTLTLAQTRTRMPSSGDDTSDNSPHIRRRSAHITSTSYDNIVDLHTRTLLGQNSLETTTPYTQLKRSKSERKSGTYIITNIY